LKSSAIEGPSGTTLTGDGLLYSILHSEQYPAFLQDAHCVTPSTGIRATSPKLFSVAMFLFN